jgi:hypothetical protein
MKSFFVKISVICALVLGSQLVFHAVTDGAWVPPMAKQLQDHIESGVDVVYFGDSSVKDIAPDDSDTRNLVAMLDDALTGHSVGNMAEYASSAEIFEGYSALLSASPDPPRVVVFPINLRSFSPTWDLRPEYQFEKLKYVLRHPNVLAWATLRPMILFRAIDLIPISQAEFEASPVYFGTQPAGVVRDYEQGMLDESSADYFRKQFLYRYAYPLNAEHRKLKALAATVRNLQDSGIAPIVYITPIDYYGGLNLSGDLFEKLIEKNIDVISDKLAAEGITILDLSRKLQPDSFCYEMSIHEHLDQDGRAYVVGEIEPLVRNALESPK